MNSEPMVCEECGEELADGEDSICDNCCYGDDYEDDGYDGDDP